MANFVVFTDNLDLINVHFFDMLPAISSGKIGDLFLLGSGNPLRRKVQLYELNGKGTLRRMKRQ